MSDKPSDDGPSQRAVILLSAEKSLTEAVEIMRRKLGLTHNTTAIVKNIKATMDIPLPPHNLTVRQTLYEHERDKVRNRDAVKTFPDVKQQFDGAIRELTIAIEGKASTRQLHKLAGHAWKWDSASDRRAREGSAAPYRGRPERYDPDVVLAFADTIARTAGRECFSLGHHGDKALTQKDKGGLMFRALVASVEWATVAIWSVAAPFGTTPPTVKPEGILTALKRVR